MRLVKLQEYFKENKIPFTYAEEEELGSLDFEVHGIAFHVWEFCEDGVYGAESNVESCGRHKDYEGDYEQTILDIISKW